jgi:hypothetical protein
MEEYGFHYYGTEALGFIFLKNIHFIKLSTTKYSGVPNPEMSAYPDVRQVSLTSIFGQRYA